MPAKQNVAGRYAQRGIKAMLQIEKEKWANWIKFEIKELADKEFQERIWVRGGGPEASSFVEVYCRLFDDRRFEEFIKNAHLLGFKPELVVKLSELRDLMNNYDEKHMTHSEIINDPKWNVIREKAKEILTEWSW